MDTKTSLIFTAPEMVSVGLIQGILEDNGITTFLKNENLAVLAWRVEPADWWPELWVWDADFARAQEIVRTVKGKTNSTEAAWVCPKCGEVVEGQFTACWNCGTEHPTS